MKRGKLLVVTGLAAVIVSSAGTHAQGPRFRESLSVRGIASSVAGDHLLTFSGPLALPGVSLGAGTYIFRRPGGNVLQVMNDRREPYAMLLTLPTTRTGPIDNYEIILGAPAAPGSPKRIEAWFLPGEAMGQELVYRDR